MSSHKADIVVEAGKATPPAVVTFAAKVMGLSLSEWVAIATLCYIALQAVYLLWKWRHERSDRERKDRERRINKQSGKASIRAIAAMLALSAGGLGLIASHEGLRTTAYLDPVGIPTICYGSTAGVELGQRATFDECNRLLQRDTTYAGKAVARCTHVAITQAQYDALVSFSFNVGGEAYCRSTLARRLNAGDCWGAAAQFDRWVHAGGRKLPGLIKRRSEERALFETGCEREAA